MSYSILLKGFTPAAATRVGEQLTRHGHRVVRTIDGAQLIVTGPEAGREVYQLAQQRGLRLVTWEQFRRKKLEPNTDGGALLASASDPVADGGPEGNTAPRVLPLLERGENGWRVLDQVMPSASSPVPTTERGLVPGAGRFRHVCFDQPFADTLRAVCIGAADDLPVALEGDTSASKTTAVLYLAHLLEQPVLRFNLNGQTDTGELVGRYVPGSVTDALDVEELRHHAALLRSESRELLELAGAENRGLTPLEAMLLAAREGLPAVGWRFQEGCLPRAARRGLWLLLDEMNLAEPQVLERLNPVLEQPRTLVLSEGDGSVLGPGGDAPFHERFRLFATLNPAEYSGRSVLSPAFRDRWSVWHQARIAGEPEYRAMLWHLATGEHPVVQCQGVNYQAAASEPVFPRLAELPRWETLTQQLALFQASVVKASGMDGSAPTLGRLRRERYSFTRRTLLSALERMDRHLAAGGKADMGCVREALELFYVHRLRDMADRAALAALMRAADL